MIGTLAASRSLMMDWRGYTKRDAAAEIGARHDLILATDPDRGRDEGRPAAVVHRASLGSGSGQLRFA